MKPLSQRLLSCSLATAYAVLALFGGALHDCTGVAAAAGDAGSCVDCCCHSHDVTLTRDAAAANGATANPNGWSSERSSAERTHESCAVCQALAQLKLGKTALPTSLPGVTDALLSRIGSDGQAPSAPLLTHGARGPPTALSTV